MVEHQLGPSVGRCVLAEQGPGVGVDVVSIEVALQRLAVPDARVEVTSERVDLPPLGVDAHLVAGASAWTVLTQEKRLHKKVLCRCCESSSALSIV